MAIFKTYQNFKLVKPIFQQRNDQNIIITEVDMVENDCYKLFQLTLTFNRDIEVKFYSQNLRDFLFDGALPIPGITI